MPDRSESDFDLWLYRILTLGYWIGAALTLAFLRFVRLRACEEGICALSLLKAFIWAAIWPLLWAIYLPQIGSPPG
jgi:hypothetical protein